MQAILMICSYEICLHWNVLMLLQHVVASNGEQVSRTKDFLAQRQTTTSTPQAAGGKSSEFHFGKVN